MLEMPLISTTNLDLHYGSVSEQWKCQWSSLVPRCKCEFLIRVFMFLVPKMIFFSKDRNNLKLYQRVRDAWK